jgi:hypothetical protein
MMAQMAFRLTYRKSQHQEAFPIDTYRLLVQYLGLQFGHQLLHVVDTLGQRTNRKIGEVSRVELRGRDLKGNQHNNTTRNQFELRFKLRALPSILFSLFGSLRKRSERKLI